MLDMKYEEENRQRQMAQYLPEPLFYLYLQARAYLEILGAASLAPVCPTAIHYLGSFLDKSVSLSVGGDVDEAKKKLKADDAKSGTQTPG